MCPLAGGVIKSVVAVDVRNMYSGKFNFDPLLSKGRITNMEEEKNEKSLGGAYLFNFYTDLEFFDMHGQSFK